ncbi:aminotransferase class III-fold pyridoxal phosphate-dependent enzyme [Cohnella sp. GbtcB17]|uniref:aminotransferase class III-fold pyridoxal phosphate-dependent enzyme n=1 Tax=Cohnella sp. GbtcB17 TaxID=2824762 RepID=UPI0020C66B44|nr:aminotransferase class III-fold pyridoxal phosphate-dependent enzyme [Cohnella sp. GbtcB17]
MESVVTGGVLLSELPEAELEHIANEEIDFLPESFVDKMDGLLEKVGTQVAPAMENEMQGAPTNAFRLASNLQASPLGGLGYLRLGEDGRLYLAAKSEHYHTPYGHNFPGYRLIDNARKLGITNATHNNTRGFITRLLERELVRTVNGLTREESEPLEEVLDSRQPHVLNRVINLETGTLACEAAMKMMLSRFYKLEDTFPEPRYKGRIPVFFVMADYDGGTKANYHGTTVLAQTLRGMWPEMYGKMREAGIFESCPIRINDIEDFKAKFEKYNKPPYKVAGFLHEIVLMNYGGIRLAQSFLEKAYELCHRNDTPVMCDEIQSCMWYPGMYLFRAYGLNPDFVVIGKGFPGGQYPASRIITTAEMDTLNQFGALVTNGQQELASLAYLITMKFAEENGPYIQEMGRYYEERLAALAETHPSFIAAIEGKGHLSTLFFREADQVKAFTESLGRQCIDISAQTYKAKCPPAALTKPPIIATKRMIDFLVAKMDETLINLSAAD